jgi:hypothetical protein
VASRLSVIFASLLLLSCTLIAERSERPAETRVDASFEARSAFFLRSDLHETLSATASGLKTNPDDPELLFLRMETAALTADTNTTLESALKLCSSLRSRPDARGSIAAARILDLAGNSSAFRKVLPAVQRLVAEDSPYSKYLRGALVAAASEGIPGVSLLESAHAAGLLTDWRIAGPFGKYSNVDFDRVWPPETDSLRSDISGGMAVEQVRYDDGNLLLPEYFPHRGVFYAATKVSLESAATRMLRVESPGTLQVFVDQKGVLLKDARFESGSEVSSVTLHLSAGSHSIVVKCIPNALPLRVSLLPINQTRVAVELRTSPDQAGELEAAYIEGARTFWQGVYSKATSVLTNLRAQHEFAAVDYLLAEAWANTADDSPEASAYLTSSLQLAPDAQASNYLLAVSADDNDRSDEAWQRLMQVVKAAPDFAPAQHLAFRIAKSHNWTPEAISAIDAELSAHPSCDVLRHAYHFYADHQQYARAGVLLTQSEACAPGATTYADLLSESGRHAEAAKNAAHLVSANPLSREPRLVLARELALNGDEPAAHRAMLELARIAPNSRQYRKMADSCEAIAACLEENAHGSDFAADSSFYSPFRQDGRAYVKETASKLYSGIPAVTLLDDRMTQLHDDGAVSVYVHRVTRIVTREGVEKYGEVSLPEDAEVLELRTIQADGSISEPEFSEHKSTISMPALSPGASIDQEYVLHFAPADIDVHREYFSFTFGSFTAPILRARFVALSPQSTQLVTRQVAGAPTAKVQTDHGQRVQIWQRDDIGQSSQESSVPAREILPTVKLFAIPNAGWNEVRDYYRDLLIDAAKVGPRTLATAASLKLGELSDTAKIAAIDNYLNFQVQDNHEPWTASTLSSAEETLASGEGDRTIAAIALARAAAVGADLVLARDVSKDPPVISLSAFQYPLALIHVGSVSKLLDVRTTGATLGEVAPILDRHEALLVPLLSEPKTSEPNPKQIFIAINSLVPAGVDEQSTAVGELHVNAAGDLQASVTITLGSWRAAQMRTSLAATESGERAQFFRQMANRLFNGATNATWDLRNEHDLEAPLQIVLKCQVPHLLRFDADQIDMDQLVPALGLRQMYTSTNSRRFPLFLDTPLIERTTFHVTLPPNLKVLRHISPVTLRTDFGSYVLAERDLGGNTIEITRAFDIPVQVITPARYADFSAFAERIDRAERDRFTFAVNDRSIINASSSR